MRLPSFICKGAYGNIRDKATVLRGQSRTLTVWSAGSFVGRKDKDLQENWEVKNEAGEEVRNRQVISSHRKGDSLKKDALRD
jgi:hypothetical protein